MLTAALEQLPPDVEFADADDELVRTIEDVVDGFSTGRGPHGFDIPDADRTMVSKVFHRMRPRLVPLYDRVISDRYRRGLGDKRYGKGIDLLFAIRDDLRLESNREALAEIRRSLEEELDPKIVPSDVRLLDIAIWMDARSPPDRD